jgi:hypothetical protein
MSNRLTAFGSLGMTAMMFCAAGCSKGGADRVLWPKEVTVHQGDKAEPVQVNLGDDPHVEGERDGVTASVSRPAAYIVVVSAARNAKLGELELHIVSKAGKTAVLKVVVLEAVLEATDDKSAEVERGGAEVAHKVQFRTHDVFFEWEKEKKAFSVSGGKDGLSAKLDPSGELIRLRATETAQLGEQQLTVRGEKYMYYLRVKVKDAAPK